MAEPELSAIVLCYRAGQDLVPYCTELYGALVAAGRPFELVLVANYDDDDDETPAVARAFAESQPHTRWVARSKGGAMGWDLRSGLDAANGRVLVVTDGDGQYAASDVVRAYERLVETGANLVAARRTKRGDGAYRRVVTVVYNALFALLFPGRAIWDVNGKPKAITRDAYRSLRLRSDDWFVDAELVLEARRAGLRIEQFPVAYAEGSRPSFVKPGAILEFVRNMLRYRLTGRVG